MYESLKAYSNKFHLYIFAFDDISFQILNKLKLNDVTIVSLSEFETPELLTVKEERSKAEYCWTCTPSTIHYVLSKFNVSNCTYIDSDLLFFSDPAVLIKEMRKNKKKVLITEHRYSLLPKLYEEKRAGRFCVQFMTFTNESYSLKILERWRLQCIDWCYVRHEDGKFGDQKYLDEWPVIYDNVHILENQGGGIAPWNILKYRIHENTKQIICTEKKTGSVFDMVFYHFQYVKFLETGSFDVGWYFIPQSVKRLLYLPYLRKISELEINLMNQNQNYITVFSKFANGTLKDFFKNILKKSFGYNIIKNV
jgi:hypothetical protein